MKLDRFTQKAREAIQAAISLAAERKHAQVAPIHLLAALLRAEDSLAQQIIDRVGVSVDVETPLRALPTLGTVAEPNTDPDVLAVLRGAEHEAREQGDSYITVEHLLLSLAGHNSSAGDARRAAGPTKRRSRRRHRRSAARTPRRRRTPRSSTSRSPSSATT